MRALLARYPTLARLPHVDLGVRETPLERWAPDGVSLLVKRDDLSAPGLGGNKVRALELLLGAAPPGRPVLTVGATGSTHALAVATYATRLGLSAQVIDWPQEQHDVARATATAIARLATVTHARSPAEAMVRAVRRRLGGGVHWIPAGGSSPLGAIGHADSAVELADELERSAQLVPDTLVVPLGSGGTAAGLLVGLAVAGLPTRVVGVQVVPRIVASHRRVARMARRTHALLTRMTGMDLPPVDTGRLEIERSAYGGAYGRETTAGREATEAIRRAGGPRVEPTYSAKALSVALARARRSPRERVLFWLTFDARWLDAGPRPR